MVFIPIRLRNQIWDTYHFSLARNCGSVAPEPRIHHASSSYGFTGFNEYMPQGQRTLTEVDGVVEIGPVGPAAQKEVAPAQANNSRKRDAAEAAPGATAKRRPPCERS